MPRDTQLWPRYISGPKDGEMIAQETVSCNARLATVMDGGEDFTYYRRKLIFNGLTVVVYSPSEMGTAEVINELMEKVVDSHPDMETYRGE
jgi:hypothetical protein